MEQTYRLDITYVVFLAVISRSASGRKEKDTSPVIGSDIITNMSAQHPGSRNGRISSIEVCD